MRTRIDCCYQCPDRYPGCHGECEKYIQQKKELEESKAEAMRKAEISRGIRNQKYDSAYRVTRYRNYRDKYR